MRLASYRYVEDVLLYLATIVLLVFFSKFKPAPLASTVHLISTYWQIVGRVVRKWGGSWGEHYQSNSQKGGEEVGGVIHYWQTVRKTPVTMCDCEPRVVGLRVLVQLRHTLFEWSHYSGYHVGEVCNEMGSITRGIYRRHVRRSVGDNLLIALAYGSGLRV
jgi:hypothetical protein